jgi:multicomponent Na+:H+ antiporter subunit D
MGLSDVVMAPALIMILGGLVLPLFPRPARPTIFLVVSLLALVRIWLFPEGTSGSVGFTRYELILCQVDSLSRVFGTIFAFIAFAGGVYAFHLQETAQRSAALLYGGGALGVVFAGDFVSLFMFWELMALSSAYLIWARRNVQAQRAGMRYLVMHAFGGSLLLAGILVHIIESGSTLVSRLSSDGGLATWLILLGVGVNAAIPPLHAWLSDAYPRATVTGAVFLSAFTTKSAVYVLARVFPGFEILIVLGVIMALYGVVYAVLANDIREILAYHIISQVGYMVTGVGIGTAMAINGAAAHAFSHILYKSLLFMGAGVVLESTGKSKLTELGGLGKFMPLTVILYMIGAFSISGFPLFNGFISKSMVVAAAGASGNDLAMMLLHLASIGTFLHTGLKLPFFTWFGKSSGLKPKETPVNMRIGMGLVATLCVLFGVAPGLLYARLPYPVNYEPYTVPHLVETAEIMVFTFVAFWIFKAKLAGEPLIALDTDWFYRRPAAFLRRIVVDGTMVIFDGVDRLVMDIAAWAGKVFRNPARFIPGTESSAEGESVSDFDPDEARPTLEFVLTMILLTFSILGSLALIWLAR